MVITDWPDGDQASLNTSELNERDAFKIRLRSTKQAVGFRIFKIRTDPRWSIQVDGHRLDQV